MLVPQQLVAFMSENHMDVLDVLDVLGGPMGVALSSPSIRPRKRIDLMLQAKLLVLHRKGES